MLLKNSILTLLCVFKCVHGSRILFQNETKKNFIYNTYEYDTLVDVVVNDTTTQVLDFYEDTDNFTGYPTRVDATTNDSVRGEYPLFLTAAQQKGVSSWELPLVLPTPHEVLRFTRTARTLCPHDAGPNITSQGRPTLTLATSSPQNLSVSIRLRRVVDFYVQVNKAVELNVTPSTPEYYYFSFDRDPWNASYQGFLPRFNYTIPKSVLLMIDSDDDVCAVVSIQNNSCPVFDNEEDVLYQGYHFTMTTKGGITVTQSMFPKGFYVVFIVKHNDEECTGVSETEARASGMELGAKSRHKHFKLLVVAAASFEEYATGAAAALALVAVIAVLGPLSALVACRCTEEVVVVEEEAGPSTSAPPAPPAGDDTKILLDDATALNVMPSEPEDSASEEEAGGPGGPGWPGGPRGPGGPLTLAGLSRAPPAAHARRSDRYFWSALTVALVYALPVVQLLSTYQRMIFETGDQDLCYYNFLCAHPLGPLADSNHVFSNLGYVVLGLVFMAQTRWRQVASRTTAQGMGIPQHAGLFYSMGLALTMEGVLSACYHLCPNHMNFQFDSSFMYVIAVLCMVKLYQSRHPDVNASAHATFMLLAACMAIGVVGIMYPSVYFWVLFTVLHLAICFVLTFKIYYVGKFKFDAGIYSRTWTCVRARGWRALRPRHGYRALVIAVADVANIALAAYGLYEHNRDFARHLLAILMGNTILYMFGYVVCKLVAGERVAANATLQLVAAHAAWALAAALFLDSRTKWSQTPAQSRTHNAACSALGTFDSHDLWHLASAAAIFFSFNALLVIDEPLRDTPRHLIPVF